MKSFSEVLKYLPRHITSRRHKINVLEWWNMELDE